MTEKVIAMIVIGTIAVVAMYKIPDPVNIVINAILAISAFVTGQQWEKWKNAKKSPPEITENGQEERLER